MKYWSGRYTCVLLVACVPIHLEAARLYDASIKQVNGKPMLAITNRSSSSITGMVITMDLSNGNNLAEERIYYDSVMDDVHNPFVGPGHTTLVPLGYFVGSDVTQLSPEIHAMLFYNGTAVGDDLWIKTVLSRRSRLLQRLTHIQRVIGAHMDPRALGSDLISDLVTDKQRFESSSPDDEMRTIDALEYDAALSTVKNVSLGGTSGVWAYSEALERKVERLKLSLSSFPHGWQPTAPPKPLANSSISATPGRHSTSARLFAARLRESDTLEFVLRTPGAKFADLYLCNINSVAGIPTSDHSTVVTQLSSCGPSQKWDLKMGISNVDKTTGAHLPDVVFDAGYANAYGACWASYTDCNGVSQPSGADAGSKHGNVTDDGTTTRFHWVVDDYTTPGTSACNQCAPDPLGVIFNPPVDNAYIPALYYFADSTTAPGCVIH